MTTDLQTQLAQIEQAIAAQESLRGLGVVPEETIAATLEQLRHRQAELQDRLAGHSVTTQDSTLSGGDRAILSSSAIRDQITGDGNQITNIINIYAKDRSQISNEDTLRRQIAGYLRWMVDRFSKIELRGIKREGRQVVQLELETVYVPLTAKSYQSSEIQLDQVLQLGQRIVITGGPGCGKTTVLLHLAYTLSFALGTDKPQIVESKLGLRVNKPLPPEGYSDWREFQDNATDEEKSKFLRNKGNYKDVDEYLNDFSLPLPIFIPLSSYAYYLRDLPPGSAGTKRTLAAFISDYLLLRQTGFDLPPDFFQHLLRTGQQVILLLDGLDEVPDETQRPEVRQAIEDLLHGRDRLRVVVTCRTAAYKNRTALGRGFQEIQVLPLDGTRIRQMVQQAYASPDLFEVDPYSAAKKADQLLDAIAKLEVQRHQLYGEKTKALVTSPLLVRMLLIVHYSERRLPDQRAELYMKATDAMLLPEYAPDEDVANRLGGLIGGSREVHRELVQHLAFAMHQRGEQQGREIDEDDLRQILQAHPIYGDKTSELIAITRLRGTLLEERLGVYRFIHLAFQEYLAARYLAETLRSHNGLPGIVTFFENGLILDSWWREPALLVAGYLSLTALTPALDYLLRLAGAHETATERTSLSADTQLAAAEVAGSAALEWRTAPEWLKVRLAEQLNILFQTPAIIGQTNPSRRAASGDILARLGDPRLGVITVDEMELCYVPPGSFIMGSPDDDELVYEDEKPLHKRDISYGYWLARYPVTVAQFKSFVTEMNFVPQDENILSDPLNHPVRYITWYEALDFCHWLSERWHKQTILPMDWQVTLPSEAEWEKAARGGREIPQTAVIQPIVKIRSWQDTVPVKPNPTPTRRYPWGNEVDSRLVNYGSTGLGTTSAVGCFPGGASPYGCEEMSGNVYEWCRTKWQESYDGYQNDNDLEEVCIRVLRGGAFYVTNRYVRCAVRLGNDPDLKAMDNGFRIMLSPVP